MVCELSDCVERGDVLAGDTHWRVHGQEEVSAVDEGLLVRSTG